MQKGFIQIPILIAIIVGVFIAGGAGYVGIKQYQDHRTQSPQPQENSIVQDEQIASTTELSEIAKLRQELDDLKKQAVSPKSSDSQPAPKPQLQSITPVAPKTGATLSNTDIIKRLKPATVFIETTEGKGSGIIIESDGYILTNAHVVSGVSSAKIKLSDGRSFTASIVGKNEIIDIALLKIAAANLTNAELGNSDEVAQGDEVFAFGYPFGIEGDVSFKEGTISRKLTDSGKTYLETSTEIHPGNSGGPLVNEYGQVIGINTMVLGKSIAGIPVGETIKFAIPINTAKNLIPDLKNGKVILDVKQTQYAEFSKFEDTFIKIIDDGIAAYDILESAEIQFEGGNYDGAVNKVKEGIAVFDSTIQQFQIIKIPGVPFSTTISELVGLYIKEFQYQKTIATYSKSKYEAALTLNNITTIDQILFIIGERNKVVIEEKNFYNTQLKPKAEEYNEKVEAYFE